MKNGKILDFFQNRGGETNKSEIKKKSKISDKGGGDRAYFGKTQKFSRFSIMMPPLMQIYKKVKLLPSTLPPH